MNEYRKIEYLKSFDINNLPDGMDIVREGVEIGKGLIIRKSRFLKEHGYSNYMEYKKECMRTGKIHWRILMGLSTLEEQLDGIRQIHSFSQRTGLDIHTIQCIPSMLVALPKAYRENAPVPTSYTLDSLDDWLAHGDAAPMEVFFQDHMLCCPNSLETTINSIKAGSPDIGFLSQFIWSQPGFTDHRQHMIDVVKSLGIVASKKEEYVGCSGYLDDSFAGYAMDCITYVGSALLEHYIVTTLCGARYSVSYGGLLSEGQNRMAVGMAIHTLLATEDQPVIQYINGSTNTQWDHDIESNYGPSAQEMLLETLVERKYRMGMSINPVSITEKITVPTAQELTNIFAVGSRLEEIADQWDDLMDFTPLEKIRDGLIEGGRHFFRNVLERMEKAGVNIKDPLEILMMLKMINPSRFESLFHPNTDENDVVIPYYPTVLGKQTVKLKEDIVKDLEANGFDQNTLAGKKVTIVSGDGHSYGLLLVDGVLSHMGAKTVNGGVDIDPIYALDLAEEEGSDYILISIHCGQSLDYARQITELAKKRGKNYHIFIGGKLNAILPGQLEATDVTELINQTGVYAIDDLVETVRKINKLK